MRGAGYGLFVISGLVMFVFEVIWFAEWWGGIGVAVALFIPPVAVLFPFIYLVMEGFSALYFGVWAMGIAGAGVAGLDR